MILRQLLLTASSASGENGEGDTEPAKSGKPRASMKTNLQWLFLVPLKGGIGGIVHPPIGSIYHIYHFFPLIYCLLGGYMLPTTFLGNQKQPLKSWLIESQLDMVSYGNIGL